MDMTKQIQQIQMEMFGEAGITSWIFDVKNNTIAAAGIKGMPASILYENVPDSLLEKGLFYPLDKKKVRDFFREIKEGSPSGSIEVRWHASEFEEYQWYRYSYTTVFEDGEPISAVCVEQKIQAEKELWEKNHHLYGRLMEEENALEGVLLRHAAVTSFYILLFVDGNTGRAMEYLEHPNESNQRMVPIENIDVNSEKYVRKYCKPEQVDAVIAKSRLDVVLQKLKENDTYTFFMEGKNVKGENRYMKCKCTYINRELNQLCYAFTDVTEVVLQETLRQEALELAIKNAEQAKYAKETFLANISHQIRTPLNAIVGMAEIAKLEWGDKDKIAECMDVVLSSSQTLINMLNDLLDSSQASAGNIVIIPSPCDMYKLMEQTVSDFRSLYLHSGQSFTYNIRIRNAQVVCDSNRLLRALLNVLGNAAKFTPSGGSICFNVWEEASGMDKSKYHFEIKDTGKGISKEDIKHVFEPFYRDQDSAENYLEGNGLGLSVVKEILDAKGATISIESELGEGTRVEIIDELPILDVPSARGCDERDKDALLLGRKVLLVEDQPINLMVARRMLERYGAIVDATENGKMAYELYMKAPAGTYDIVFMDIQMPVMNGYEATKAIRNSQRADASTVKIVSMTADVFPEDIQRAKNAGMNAHIGKPIRAEELTDLIETLLKM